MSTHAGGASTGAKITGKPAASPLPILVSSNPDDAAGRVPNHRETPHARNVPGMSIGATSTVSPAPAALSARLSTSSTVT